MLRRQRGNAEHDQCRDDKEHLCPVPHDPILCFGGPDVLATHDWDRRWRLATSESTNGVAGRPVRQSTSPVSRAYLQAIAITMPPSYWNAAPPTAPLAPRHHYSTSITALATVQGVRPAHWDRRECGDHGRPDARRGGRGCAPRTPLSRSLPAAGRCASRTTGSAWLTGRGPHTKAATTPIAGRSRVLRPKVDAPGGASTSFWLDRSVWELPGRDDADVGVGWSAGARVGGVGSVAGWWRGRSIPAPSVFVGRARPLPVAMVGSDDRRGEQDDGDRGDDEAVPREDREVVLGQV